VVAGSGYYSVYRLCSAQAVCSVSVGCCHCGACYTYELVKCAVGARPTQHLRRRKDLSCKRTMLSSSELSPVSTN